MASSSWSVVEPFASEADGGGSSDWDEPLGSDCAFPLIGAMQDVESSHRRGTPSSHPLCLGSPPCPTCHAISNHQEGISCSRLNLAGQARPRNNAGQLAGFRSRPRCKSGDTGFIPTNGAATSYDSGFRFLSGRRWWRYRRRCSGSCRSTCWRGPRQRSKRPRRCHRGRPSAEGASACGSVLRADPR